MNRSYSRRIHRYSKSDRIEYARISRGRTFWGIKISLSTVDRDKTNYAYETITLRLITRESRKDNRERKS